MTKQEIIAEINAKIAGQGTNIDAGSALPGILQGIIDLIPEAPTPQVQSNLLERNPESPAYVNGILRLVVNDQELLEVDDERWLDLLLGSGVSFVGTPNDSRLFPAQALTDSQKTGLVALISDAVGAQITGILAFFGHASENVEDGTSGFAVVPFANKYYSFYCDF